MIRTAALALAALITLVPAAEASGQRDVRDNRGERVGTVRQDAGNDRLRIQDNAGRRVGTAREGADGRVRLYDREGRRIGTVR
ncbi:hypothetical protein [Microcystis phage Mwe-JY26]